ncbi:MAG: PTS sugar transporter subunit IIA [Planctomycetota bacterium]|jgi:mannitol/fructose-specific phosphotransferase system IIA component (Ntr-type)|nr:PTS sugar transporter subunit IIA [Planctomycetota bacterium]MDP6762957.1 PTS sugar transporter subunit IIA [Planctomycetota bacterium]MDP6990552.1 PTS sugar transporter subunit IIA [Planctomycetota bacterium]
MRLTELFAATDLVVDFDPADKWDSISRLVDHLASSGRLPAECVEEVREAVIHRERSMSTGMEHGIAIPHAAVDGIETVAAAMGVVRREDGLPFESIDGRPARLVVLLVIPRAQKLLHIRTLADVARVLGQDSVREGLLGATTDGEAWSALREGELEVR